MNHLTLQSGSLFAVTALAMGGLALPTNAAENDVRAPLSGDETYRMNETESAQRQTLTGTVVNLQQFLLTDRDTEAEAGQDPEAKPQQKAPKDAPLGLCVENEGIIGALTTEQTYLIVFDPNDDKQEDAYKDARDLVGKNVTLTGRILERGSISGVLISKVEQAAPQQASAQKPQP